MSGALAHNKVSTDGEAGALPGAKRRVLYAEDSTSSRIVTTAMLKRLGFIVDAVEDGELALQLAKINDYDLILLDIEMPVMDGVTAARCIRSEAKRQSKTPILALSAFLADSTEFTVWRDAFDSALPKPANRNELISAMNRAIASRAPNVTTEEKCVFVRPQELGSILQGLRETLPSSIFFRLMDTAAEEMRHSVLVLGSAIEAQDPELFLKAAHSLIGLSTNFENVELAKRTNDVKQQGILDINQGQLLELFAIVESWRARL
jgi:CheY-like chemotaxis protein